MPAEDRDEHHRAKRRETPRVVGVLDPELRRDADQPDKWFRSPLIGSNIQYQTRATIVPP
jgi:hypothetical protein